jgi:hypothetical protein
VNNGPLSKVETSALACARSSGVKSMRSSSLSPCRSNGGGRSGNRGLRYRSLDDRPDRLAALAVEDVGEPLLAHLDDGLDRAAGDAEIDQHRRRRQVVVPDAVVDHLEMPRPLSGARVEGDQALGKEVVAGSVPAIEVVGRRAEGEIDQPELLVG